MEKLSYVVTQTQLVVRDEEGIKKSPLGQEWKRQDLEEIERSGEIVYAQGTIVVQNARKELEDIFDSNFGAISDMLEGAGGHKTEGYIRHYFMPQKVK